MSLPYTQEMLDSIKKVEATRAERVNGPEPRRMTMDEKDALLEKFHPDYNTSSFEEIKVGPNKGQKAPRISCHASGKQQNQGHGYQFK